VIMLEHPDAGLSGCNAMPPLAYLPQTRHGCAQSTGAHDEETHSPWR
jgi:hypothetical protein